MELELNLPRESHENEWYSIVSEFEENDKEIIPYSLKMGINDYYKYLRRINEYKNNINVPWNFVSSTTFFLQQKGCNRILGAINIRHKLNDYLINFGGHIGYGIRPTERKKGYAGKMLELGLEKCKELGLSKILITCKKNNIASAKTIKKNGGILENEIEDVGVLIQRYWIKL